MIDWFDAARNDEISFSMVDPNNLDREYGQLTSVVINDTSLSYGYDVETRTSGSIKLLDDTNYIQNSWVRVYHKVNNEGYPNELGTYILANPIEEYSGEGITRSYDMYSVLWGIKEDLYPGYFQIASNASSDEAFKLLCETCKRPYRLIGTSKYTYDNAAVFELGDSFLSMLYSVASTSNNRIDIDGHGRIIISKYIAPNKISPTWTLDVDDPRSIIREGSIKMESSINDVPSRIIVTDTSSNSVILAYSDVSNISEYSSKNRGYIKAELKSDLKPGSYNIAKVLADYYAESVSKTVEWSMETLYFPCKPGDTCTFIRNKVEHYCLIDAIDSLNLDSMTMSLTLRELTKDRS